MSSPTSSKVHTKIGNERSLCGLNPHRGHYRIASWSSFFSAPLEDQCDRCILAIERRGYDVEKERLQFRSLYDKAQAMGFPAHILPA
jgi:hypothetical protein